MARIETAQGVALLLANITKKQISEIDLTFPDGANIKECKTGIAIISKYKQKDSFLDMRIRLVELFEKIKEVSPDVTCKIKSYACVLPHDDEEKYIANW